MPSSYPKVSLPSEPNLERYSDAGDVALPLAPDALLADAEAANDAGEERDLAVEQPEQRISIKPTADDVGELFNVYRHYVAKIGRRILGNHCDIEDLIQDVFVATLRDIHKLRDPERLRAWLGTVTTRMAKRRRFRDSVQPARASDHFELDEVSEEGPGPESTADLSGNIRTVMSLPDELRVPWMLKHVEGRTLQDVARQCDCSTSTAQRRIQDVQSRIGRRR